MDSSLPMMLAAGAVSAAAKCSTDMYFDNVTDSCAPCSDICLNRRMQKTEEDCEEKCGSYLSSLTESTTKATTAAASHSPDAHKTWTIVAVCVILFLCLIFMAVLVYRLRTDI
ncbi:uncharacterized protein LOC128553265, partial [Mercenaria mercenaria]|uniref:uncharacterized protein LOC128553265 n=1 Tax=Mercenaria mercenaria TaxID=6596 RepID=UPI00234EB04B